VNAGFVWLCAAVMWLFAAIMWFVAFMLFKVAFNERAEAAKMWRAAAEERTLLEAERILRDADVL